MIIIDRREMPLDHSYFRTSSPVYKKYLWKCSLKIHEISENRFWWIKDIFWLFNVAKFEKLDEEPDIEKIKKDGFKHWFVIWVPYSRTDIPAWWKKLRVNTHFTTTWFTKIEDEFYYKKWKERSKRARKKFLANKELSIQLVDTETFQKYYKESKLSQPFKADFIKYHKNISLFDNEWDIKNMICFHNGKVIAWLSGIDYNGNSSAHLVSFLTKEWKKLQAWTGLIDYWFKISLENGLKYINFDHLRDSFMPKDQQWYTDFKENFMDYKVVFRDSYFKLV